MQSRPRGRVDRQASGAAEDSSKEGVALDRAWPGVGGALSPVAADGDGRRVTPRSPERACEEELLWGGGGRLALRARDSWWGSGARGQCGRTAPVRERD